MDIINWTWAQVTNKPLAVPTQTICEFNLRLEVSKDGGAYVTVDDEDYVVWRFD